MIFSGFITFNQANADKSIPSWINTIILWYEEEKLTKAELATSLSYLDKKGIIDASNIAFQNILSEKQSKYEIMVTKGIKHIVDLNKIKSGGPPPDGIPSIDNPKFVNGSQANFVSENDLIIGVSINGITKTYPLFIMNWHEIVNDNFGEVPVAVTYCPLCFTSQIFERIIDGTPVEFGTSGKLYNSNLVMYDRLTNSYWSQGLGVAIRGDLSGESLKTIPFDVMKWSDWISLYPDTLVMTKETGHLRPYSSEPYSDYFKDPRVLFSLDNEDDRLPKKEMIFGFENHGNYKAYKMSDVESQKIINDTLGDKEILILSVVPFMGRGFDRNTGGQILDFEIKKEKIIDKQTLSEWNIEGQAFSGPLEGTKLNRLSYHPAFWFEWAAFHSETKIYGQP